MYVLGSKGGAPTAAHHVPLLCGVLLDVLSGGGVDGIKDDSAILRHHLGRVLQQLAADRQYTLCTRSPVQVGDGSGALVAAKSWHRRKRPPVVL